MTFAILHDLWRADDGDDPAHGERAAERFLALCQDPGLDAFGLAAGSRRAEDLAYALAHHPAGRRADDHPNVNVGICWDADRLNLWRVGIAPDPAFLTTEAARTPDASERARELCVAQVTGKLPSWKQIEARCAALGQPPETASGSTSHRHGRSGRREGLRRSSDRPLQTQSLPR